MTDFKELADTLLRAQAALDAQASAQPEIDRLRDDLNTKLDHIMALEAQIMSYKTELSNKESKIFDLETEVNTLRRERDDRGLEAMALRDELDTLKSNIDNALAKSTETFYNVMQTKPPTPTHTHEPVSDQPPPSPPETFNEPEPNSYSVDWHGWNQRRVDWNIAHYHVDPVKSKNTALDYSN